MKAAAAVYSTEFALVLACLRWPQQAADGERIRHLAQQPIHWPHLLQIVHHHKVAPLAARNLDAFAADCLPEGTAAALRAANIENAHICLRRITHLVALTQRFREAHLDLRIIKGIPLAMTAFQDPTLRESGDIDLLVAEKDIFAAGDILRAEGYVRFEPKARLTPRRLLSYLAHQKDFSYIHPTAGTVVDLHWRLFRNRWLPANAGIEQVGEQPLALGAESIPTLPAPQLLLYLCVHGALDGWLRLKWLADIYALLQVMTPQQLAATAAMAAGQQALPQFSAALLLAQDLLGDQHSVPQPVLAACLNRDHPAVARILTFSQRCMTSNHHCPVREQIPSTQWLLNELHLHNSFRYRIELLLRSLFRPRVWSAIRLPDWLFLLYPLLSPLESVLFHWRHHQQQRRQARLARKARRSLFRRLGRSRPSDLLLACEAACMLSFFRVALKLIPVQTLTAWMSHPRPVQTALAHDRVSRTLRHVEWSIAAVVRHAPFTFVCFPQCLAAYFMLRRRHIASTLFYGVTREHDQLKAHTWVKVGDRTIVGGEAAAGFTVLSTFP
jgi:hypothetical protein